MSHMWLWASGLGDTSTRLLSKSWRVCNCGINFWMIFEKASKMEWSNIEVMWYSMGTSSNPTSANSSPIRCWISRLMSIINTRPTVEMLFRGVAIQESYSREVFRKRQIRERPCWKSFVRPSTLWMKTSRWSNGFTANALVIVKCNLFSASWYSS